MLNKKELNKQFVKQHGEYSCGLACLASVVNYFGGSVSQSGLMSISGTTLNGTSMLGLYQAANRIGLDAKGYEADINSLKNIKDPVILHVLMDGNRQHFIVCYGYDGKFIIGDPGWGITEYSGAELESVWKSRAMLQLKPGKNFETKKRTAYENWNWFKDIIRDDLPILGVAAFFGVIIAVLGLSTAIYSQKLIDVYLPDKEHEKIFAGLALLAGLLLFRSVISYARGILMVSQSRNLNERIISRFLNKILYLPQSFFRGHSTGDFIARMNDARRIQTTVSLVTGQIIIEVLVVIISSAYVFYLSGLTGLVSISSIVFFLIIAWKYHRKIVASQREMMQAYAMNESNYVDILQGHGTIKSFGREAVFIDRLNNVYNIYQGKIYDLGILGNKYGFLTGSISSVYLVLILLTGISLVLKSQLHLGEFVAIMSVGGSLVPAISNLTLANVQIQEAKVAFERMHEFVKEKTENDDETTALSADTLKGCNAESLLEVCDLRFRFPGKRPLFDRVSFSLSKGAIVALYGEVGSGKSTLVDILQRFFPFEQGRIVYDGRDWKATDLRTWRSIMAVVPQKEKIFNSTVLDNISMSNDQNLAQDVLDFCVREGFHPYFEKFQQGYMTITGENGVNLSGGQRQLISLARALYKKPEILVLDEATAAMDTETEQFVFDLLRKRRDLAILIITHRKDLIRKADKIYELRNGTLTESFSGVTLSMPG